MDVLRAANALAAGGARVLHLEVGQPSSGAPEPVLRAAALALAEDRLGYTDALGVEKLRRRIALHYGEAYRIDLDWQRVAVTGGSSGGFVLAFLAAFDAGQRVAVGVPGYPAYRNILSALGVDVVRLPLDESTRFQPTPAMLDDLVRRVGRIDGLIVASPANPTSSMLDGTALAALAGWCREQGTRLISDEIYHGIAFAGRAETALSFGNDAIVVNSFSKYYAMTGWRIGWLVLPERLRRAIECLAQNLYISPPSLSQHAAIGAFDCAAILDRHVDRYAANRAVLLDALPRAGFRRLAPADGAFYLYAELGENDPDSAEVSRLLLEEACVAITPGIDFDPERGHRFVRFSYAGETAAIEEAAARLIAWRDRHCSRA
ncbi:MAG: aminotransferase class I/II-fold pyridoxal phosphate-dependent enzyme [Rhodospirillales bacterium]|nr:aminotransferase class I/II-fold pyridoxal phosphate-dependent enzyme [Rhodospirillales bacterium]